MLDTGPRSRLTPSILNQVVAPLTSAVLFQGFAIVVDKLNAGMEGTQTSIFDVHSNIFVLFGVCASKEFAARRHVNKQKSAFKLPLSASEHVQLLIGDVHESEYLLA